MTHVSVRAPCSACSAYRRVQPLQLSVSQLLQMKVNQVRDAGRDEGASVASLCKFLEEEAAESYDTIHANSRGSSRRMSGLYPKAPLPFPPTCTNLLHVATRC